MAARAASGPTMCAACGFRVEDRDVETAGRMAAYEAGKPVKCCEKAPYGVPITPTDNAQSTSGGRSCGSLPPTPLKRWISTPKRIWRSKRLRSRDDCGRGRLLMRRRFPFEARQMRLHFVI